MDAITSEGFRDNVRATADNIAEGLSVGRDASADGYWAKWAGFYQQLALDPLLTLYKDPIPILCTISQEYHIGDITASSSNVRSKTVQDDVRPVAQTLTALGARDPHLSNGGKIYYRLQLQYRCYTRQGPPLNRVKAILVQILGAVAAIVAAFNDLELHAVADMIILTFFFLLHPGGNTGTKTTSTPFHLCDVILSVGRTVFTLISLEEDF